MRNCLFFAVLATCFVGGFMQVFNFRHERKKIVGFGRSISIDRLRPAAPHPDMPPLPLDNSNCIPQPKCPPVFMDKYPTMDGSCNNRVQKNWGRVHQSLKRFLPPDYSDGKGLPRKGLRNQPLPSARVISSTMSSSVSEDSSATTNLAPFWGQFLVHDIALTPVIEKAFDGDELECECEYAAKDCINIPIPKTDRQYKEEKKICFPMKRSHPVVKSGPLECDDSVRRQENTLTSFIDLGTIYGNSEAYLSSLLLEMGKLREQKRGFKGEKSGLLPLQEEFKNTTFANLIECPAFHKPADYSCYVSGDIRVNENSALISQHTFWMRQHNSILKKLIEMNPKWDDTRLFQTTRLIVSALFQRVTYEHFLPIVLGETYMKMFGLNLLKMGYWFGYDSTYDATVANAFNTAAFRMGHSLISSILVRPDPTWKNKQGPDIKFKDSIFNAEPILDKEAGGPNSILRGLMQNKAQKFDTTVVDDLRNFLFAEEEGKLGSDLLAINIQRGRDHGIPGYIQFRKFCGLQVPKDFSDLEGVSEENKKKFASLYRAVDEIDLFIGGLAEKSVEGGTVGPTFACLISYQFRDIKRGDRFWHENGGAFRVFTIDQLEAIQAATYSKLLCESIFETKSVQPFPMKKISDSNPLQPCDKYQGLDLNPWKDDYVSSTFHKHEPDYEWTTWFPSSLNSGLTLTPAETLSYLLRHQPDHVCHQVVDTETRKINENLQVRYQCLPGTIKHSDYPSYISEDFIWTDWITNSMPKSSNKFSDYEARTYRNAVCKQPFDIQVQTIDGKPAGQTGEVFQTFSPAEGFICRGIDQESKKCKDYRVRYLCRRGEGKSDDDDDDDNDGDDSTTWTKWISTDQANGRGDLELLNNARRRIIVCRNPIRIEARTIVGHKPVSKTGDRIRMMRPNYGFLCYNRDQRRRRCNNYEVRYLCPNENSDQRNNNSNIKINVPSLMVLRANQMCKLFGLCCCDPKQKH